LYLTEEKEKGKTRSADATDRIEDNCSEKKINNTEHKITREGK